MCNAWVYVFVVEIFRKSYETYPQWRYPSVVHMSNLPTVILNRCSIFTTCIYSHIILIIMWCSKPMWIIQNKDWWNASPSPAWLRLSSVRLLVIHNICSLFCRFRNWVRLWDHIFGNCNQNLTCNIGNVQEYTCNSLQASFIYSRTGVS